MWSKNVAIYVNCSTECFNERKIYIYFAIYVSCSRKCFDEGRIYVLCYLPSRVYLSTFIVIYFSNGTYICVDHCKQQAIYFRYVPMITDILKLMFVY